MVIRYLGPKRRAGSKIYAPPQKAYAELLPKSLFGNSEEKLYKIKMKRNIDEIVGHIFSMSWSSKKLLGKRVGKFENELRQKLGALSGGGIFEDQVQFRMYMLIKK